MSKITKRIFKSIIISSVISLINTDVKAKDALMMGFDKNEDNNDKIDRIKKSLLKNVIKISPSGRISSVNGHRSHSSHRSHYSGSSGYHRSHISHTSHTSSSHSSHYSSSHSSHYSSSSITPSSSNRTSNTPRTSSIYTNPAPKTPADYSLGDRTIKVGTYGADVRRLATFLIDSYYIKESSISQKSGYPIFDANMSNAIKHFQKDAG